MHVLQHRRKLSDKQSREATRQQIDSQQTHACHTGMHVFLYPCCMTHDYKPMPVMKIPSIPVSNIICTFEFLIRMGCMQYPILNFDACLSYTRSKQSHMHFPLEAPAMISGMRMSSQIIVEESSTQTHLTVRPFPRSTSGRLATDMELEACMVEPMPSLPAPFPPQHLTLPLSSIAHGVTPLATIALAVRFVPIEIMSKLSPMSVARVPTLLALALLGSPIEP